MVSPKRKTELQTLRKLLPSIRSAVGSNSDNTPQNQTPRKVFPQTLKPNQNRSFLAPISHLIQSHFTVPSTQSLISQAFSRVILVSCRISAFWALFWALFNFFFFDALAVGLFLASARWGKVEWKCFCN